MTSSGSARTNDLLGDAEPVESGTLKDRRVAHRKYVESQIEPGETFQQAALRLMKHARTGTKPEPSPQIPEPPLPVPTTNKTISPAKISRAVTRKTPERSSQADFFIPALYDAGTRDTRSVMDVAVFRLSKQDNRASQVIRYELPNGFVEVTSGVAGMASVWDYDVLLMAASHLTEALNRHREGKGEMPGRVFRPHIGDLMKFLRRGDGGKQKADLLASFKRLHTTTLVIERQRRNGKGRLVTMTQGESLITGYKVIAHAVTQAPEYVEIEIPRWMYQEIVEGPNPDVLTVHPDYFLIDQGIGRFLYRLARQAAGRDEAHWSFETIYQRSGSSGTQKKFNQNLRRIIEANDLPEYDLSERKGSDGPLLVMTFRQSSDPLLANND